jgi:hypothetical protein
MAGSRERPEVEAPEPDGGQKGVVVLIPTIGMPPSPAAWR